MRALPREHVGQRLQLEIAVGRISLLLGQPCVPVAPVLLRLGEGRAIARHVAHPGGGTFLLVDPLGVLAAGHLHAVGRAGILHLLHRARRDQPEHGRPSADEIGRAGQRLNHGDAARDRSGICGSWGQKECSAQTCAVSGSVASLPSLWLSVPGAA